MAMSTTGTAWSAEVESIGGEYTGKVFDASQVRSKKGESCDVSIDPKAKGNTVLFKINGEQPVYVERAKVADGLASGKQKVKVQTAGARGGNVFVILKFGGNKLNLVRLKVVGQKKNWTVACGELAKK